VVLARDVPQGDIEGADPHPVVLAQRPLELAPVFLSMERVLPHQVVGDHVELRGGRRVAADVLAGDPRVRLDAQGVELALGRLARVVDEAEPVGVAPDVFEREAELDVLDPRDRRCHTVSPTASVMKLWRNRERPVADRPRPEPIGGVTVKPVGGA